MLLPNRPYCYVIDPKEYVIYNREVKMYEPNDDDIKIQRSILDDEREPFVIRFFLTTKIPYMDSSPWVKQVSLNMVLI